MVNKIVKVGETAEEKRQREQEKEDRKRINELAFKAWLKQKETQKHLDTKIQKKNKTNNEESQSTANVRTLVPFFDLLSQKTKYLSFIT